MVPNLGPPDVLGLQLPETFTITSAGQDFWELKSIWRPKVGDHCFRQSLADSVGAALGNPRFSQGNSQGVGNGHPLLK